MATRDAARIGGGIRRFGENGVLMREGGSVTIGGMATAGSRRWKGGVRYVGDACESVHNPRVHPDWGSHK